MPVRAVLFDIGGVLERVDHSAKWLEPWRAQLGMSREAFEAALDSVDPMDRTATGTMSEDEFRTGYAHALGLSPDQTDAFIRDMWDWYCGELDGELMSFAAGLRATHATAILSNSADGARREEEQRYRFSHVFDPILYSHEIGLAKPDPRIYALACQRLGLASQEIVFLDDTPHCVDGATAYGMHAILHENTPASLAAITALLD